MRILDAVLGMIEPYSFSDAAINVALIWACDRLEVDTARLDDDYTQQYQQVAALATMQLLAQSFALSAESISGGVSQSYAPDNLKKRIKALASAYDLSADLVLADDEPTVTHLSVW